MGKGEGKRLIPEKARRELAKQLRNATRASARLCEKALAAHGDDIDRAGDWLLSQALAQLFDSLGLLAYPDPRFMCIVVCAFFRVQAEMRDADSSKEDSAAVARAICAPA